MRYWPAESVTTVRSRLDQGRAGGFDRDAGQRGSRSISDDAGNRRLSTGSVGQT